MTLHDQLAIDSAVFVNADDFAESVTYNPINGTPKAIKAVVLRNPPERNPESSNGLIPDLQIVVRNDSTYGVTSIDVGRDTVTVAERFGGTAKKHTVTQIVSADEGVWVLGVR